ncbi:MAG: tetratricopeptide repeat protein [Anaerolineae bacterium]|nr:tetratricopeptide repeat protein [Anaerolineae bacterium]
MNRSQRWVRLLLSHCCYWLAASHRRFGNQYSLTQEHESAVNRFSKAIAYNPAFARAFLERGILYWRELDHPRRAVLDLTMAYELDSRLTDARFNRGIAHQQLREYAEAIADYQAYLGEGDHPHWRAYAETMIRELAE